MKQSTMAEGLGAYISIPFCRAKCTFCNFASGVFGAERMDRYVDRVCAEIGGARAAAMRLGAELPERVDTVYFGGGTPSLLEPEMVARLFSALRSEFTVDNDAEITMECAPGQLGDETQAAFLDGGMNRVSFGIQSFVDRETAAVGRLHTREQCLAEVARVRTAGVDRLSLDLIAGLPQQTEASWHYSVEEAIASGVEHISVYMLEVDEESRLGREVLGSGGRYGAASVPDGDLVAEWYGWAILRLHRAALEQYEISNFARVGSASRHNVKYWERQPYIGFGLDAHSFLRTPEGGARWANSDEMEQYLNPDGQLRLHSALPHVDRIGREAGFEESLFLGLRMNRGVNLEALRGEFGELLDAVQEGLAEVEGAGLVSIEHGVLRLTDAGRMVSNEVFGRLLVGEAVGV